jgi:hypothetical protein
MGILLIPKAKAGPTNEPIGGRAHILGWKEGRRVAIPLPTPALPGYDAAMQRADRFREHVSPLGGTAGWPWDQRPPVGEGSLKQEFRRSR